MMREVKIHQDKSATRKRFSAGENQIRSRRTSICSRIAVLQLDIDIDNFLARSENDIARKLSLSISY